MSAQISIKHPELYIQISNLRGALSEAMSDLESGYSRSCSELKDLDSATNAEFMAVIEQNRRKSEIELETLDKLLLFIKSTAEEYETLDSVMARNYSNMAITSSLKLGGIRSCQTDLLEQLHENTYMKQIQCCKTQ